MTALTKYETRNPFKLVEVELSAKEKIMWTQVKAGLTWMAPGFAHIMVTMLNPRNNDAMIYWTNGIKTLSTDGFRIAANPAYFFKLTVFERIFAIAHEIAHGMFNHCSALNLCRSSGKVRVNGKELPFDKVLGNKAVDYVVNDMLIKAKIGQFKKGWLWDTNIGTEDDMWPVVYDRLYIPPPPGGGGKDKNEDEGDDDQDESGGGGGSDDEDEEGDGESDGEGESEGDEPDDQGDQDEQGEGGGQDEQGDDEQPQDGRDEGGGQDDHMAPGSLGSVDTPAQGQQQREQLADAWKHAIEVAAKITEEALSRGSVSASQLKFFTQFLQPKISWTDQIEGTFAKKIGSGSYDYRRPDRRLITREIYAPGRSGHGCRTIIVGSDTSGSIFAVPDLLERFFAEMAEILTVYNPRRLYVLWCDAEVKRAVLIEDIYDLEREWEHGAEGGGGTSFEPVFQWVEENEIEDIDALVYLTDLAGRFPSEAPNYPVIWVSIDKDKKAPFGDIIVVPDDGTA